ncbi:MAG: hypothetical protein NT007_00120, partial [Candidatus Kapabacteria bacterium]|nr:hypothetical protein [Candidatus Kapabacteria bacterium]
KTYATQLNSDSIKQTHFITCAQWGIHPKMARALKVNCDHGDYCPDTLSSNNLSEPWQMDYIWRPDDNAAPNHNSRAFSYKANLIVNPNYFIPNYNDPERNIWGFRYCGIQGRDTSGNTLALTTGMTYTNPVLAYPWINNKFYRMPNEIDSIDKDGFDHRLTNGQHFIITVNLRRKDLNISDSAKGTAPVLSIILPYYLCPTNSHVVDTGVINFDALPDTTTKSSMAYTYYDGTNSHIINRGMCYGMVSGNCRTFTITQAMLPNHIDTIGGGSPDITISASFTCDNDLIHGHNPYFKTSDPSGSTTIDSIGMNVYYYPNSSIQLNYIRIGNPRSDKLFKGGYDTIAHNTLQSGMDIMYNFGYQYFRIDPNDEWCPEDQWDAIRYINLLIGKTTVAEGSSVDARYLYHVEPKIK